jgi:hypothetical protein
VCFYSFSNYVFLAQYNKRLEETEGKSAEELTTMNVGKLDPKKHLEMSVEELMTRNISQCLGSMLDTVVCPPLPFHFLAPYFSSISRTSVTPSVAPPSALLGTHLSFLVIVGLLGLDKTRTTMNFDQLLNVSLLNKRALVKGSLLQLKQNR